MPGGSVGPELSVCLYPLPSGALRQASSADRDVHRGVRGGAWVLVSTRVHQLQWCSLSR